MENKKWRVYVHTNKLNGKRYVGVTSKPDPSKRWSNGHGYKENSHFYSAIKLYGWDNFTHEILFEGLSEQEAKQKERELISLWDTQDSRFGYNMTSGGDGTPGYHPSEETRKKLSNARRKENLSAETLRRRSEGLRGRKFSDEHKRKIGDGNSKPVNMIGLDGVTIRTFKSARDAEISMGFNHAHISQCCHHIRQTTGGYRWEFIAQ